MKQLTIGRLSAGILLLAATTILAHEVTYEGVVAAIKPNRYAASSELLATLEVKVSELKRPMVFDITQKTRLWRGERSVSFADALIRKDERVTVTVNHDDPNEGATEIRLEAQE